MNAEKIQKLAIQIALEQPETVLSHPFGPQCNVIKVFDKMFLLTGELNQGFFDQYNQFADELKELYPSITSGYHMNKKHWISIFEGQNIDADFIEDMVKSSYALVVSKLNKTQKMRIKLLSSK